MQTNYFDKINHTTTNCYDKTTMGSIICQGSYTKLETNHLLTNKVSNIGNVSLPGHLGIGITYTSSRIRCNAEGNGYVGYAELNAASSYGMFLNLSTTRTDGGWMYFKVSNDNYMQLSGTDNKVNIYKDTTTSGNLDVGAGASQSNIRAYAIHDGDTSYIEAYASRGDQCFLNFYTDFSHGTVYIDIHGTTFLRITSWNNEIIFYKPATGTSDDRLKENEEIIENACETLSKLRPQLYYKKQTWEIMII